MMLLEFFSIVWGFSWHFFGSITAKMQNRGFSRLVDYTVGVMITLPVFVASLKKSGRFSDEQIFLATCFFLFAFLLIGVGTALGWATYPHNTKS